MSQWVPSGSRTLHAPYGRREARYGRREARGAVGRDLQCFIPITTTLVRARDYFSELSAVAGNAIQWNSWLDLAIMQEPNQPLTPIENCIYFSNIEAIRFVRCTGKDGWLRREHFDVYLPRGSLLDTETRRILGLTSEFEGQHIVYAAKSM
ncbi:hypothetical protein EXIGLDRAFT_76635 [Exidia glandulosa HHB12029]|uniref:Uncharacterized protein n=1 Tax=Exidia glandulosa HHB12029 TaxID=1314781 RepID=A0A165HR95_EXIGL|nr:hypothetical protein EXIGLDRAFT_76635 [Exidia glandulosa HHB12029]